MKGDRQNEQRKEASERLGDVMSRTREWMAPNVYYTVEFTRLLSLSGAGALRVGEARLREVSYAKPGFGIGHATFDRFGAGWRNITVGGR